MSWSTGGTPNQGKPRARLRTKLNMITAKLIPEPEVASYKGAMLLTPQYAKLMLDRGEDTRPIRTPRTARAQHMTPRAPPASARRPRAPPRTAPLIKNNHKDNFFFNSSTPREGTSAERIPSADLSGFSFNISSLLNKTTSLSYGSRLCTPRSTHRARLSTFTPKPSTARSRKKTITSARRPNTSSSIFPYNNHNMNNNNIKESLIPLRVSVPSTMNAPKRKKYKNLNHNYHNTIELSPRRDQLNVYSNIQDYSERAKACHRAGRFRSEGLSYFCMAVLYDNVNEYENAIKYYNKFHHMLTRSQDKFAISLAYNCIAISYQNIVEQLEQEIEKINNSNDNDDNNDNDNDDIFEYRNAMISTSFYYHELHLKSAINDNNRFISLTNLGIMHYYYGSISESIIYHKKALNISEKLSESDRIVALGNLGSSTNKSSNQNNNQNNNNIPLSESSAKKSFHEQLRMSIDKNDIKSEKFALNQLGLIATNEQLYDDAVHMYQQTMELTPSDNVSKMNVGISNGNLKYAEFMKEKSKLF